MLITEIINNVLAGGLLGALGQGIRIAVGLKKFNDTNVQKEAQGKPPEEFSTSRLLISIFIGFVAGAIGMLVKGSGAASGKEYDTQSIVAIIAIGYSGADFIEGFFNTYINKTTGSASSQSAPQQTPDQQPEFVADEFGWQNSHQAQG